MTVDSGRENGFIILGLAAFGLILPEGTTQSAYADSAGRAPSPPQAPPRIASRHTGRNRPRGSQLARASVRPRAECRPCPADATARAGLGVSASREFSGN